MPDVPMSLTPWFDAKDNPPGKRGTTYVTDLGLLYLRGMSHRAEWCEYLEGEATLVKPSVYCLDPSPPVLSDPLGPLTVEHLRRVLRYVEKRSPDDEDVCDAAARLRRALDQIA